MIDPQPAVFYQADHVAVNALDVLEVPQNTTFVLTNIQLTSNLPGSGAEDRTLTAGIYVNGVALYVYVLQGSTFFGGQTLSEPLQNLVVPAGQFIKFETSAVPNDGLPYYLDWHVSGYVYSGPAYVGIYTAGEEG